MSGDTCRTKNIEVEVQENGIIRDSNGWLMSRLGDDYPFEAITEKPEKKLRWHGLWFVPGFILGGGMLITFVLGLAFGGAVAMDQPCAARCNVPESIR